jgi:hypothetical protein
MNLMTNMTRLARSPGDPKVLKTGPSSFTWSDRLVRTLGWFSLGLGLYELARSQQLARTLGMEGKESLIRAYGARELASGVLCLSVGGNVGAASRVVGDTVDVATLAANAGRDNPKRDNVVTALAMVLGVTALDSLAFAASQKRHSPSVGRKVDYSDRSGLPQGVEASRGAALDGLKTPVDFRVTPPPFDERPATTH